MKEYSGHSVELYLWSLTPSFNHSERNMVQMSEYLGIYYFQKKLKTKMYQQKHCFISSFNWASMRENLSLGLPNNKGTDQPVHPHSLISTFVIRLFESIVSRLATS